MPDEPSSIAASASVRHIKAAPFCWQHKAALRLIREAFDADKTVNSALGVYCALTEIASDKESEIFQSTHAYISEKSGWSPRTVQDRIAELGQIGLVRIITPPLKAPSTFYLLPVQQPLPNDSQPLPSVQQRAKKPPLPTLEENKNKPNEQQLNKPTIKIGRIEVP